MRWTPPPGVKRGRWLGEWHAGKNGAPANDWRPSGEDDDAQEVRYPDSGLSKSFAMGELLKKDGPALRQRVRKQMAEQEPVDKTT